jgi:hypothetical protein
MISMIVASKPLRFPLDQSKCSSEHDPVSERSIAIRTIGIFKLHDRGRGEALTPVYLANERPISPGSSLSKLSSIRDIEVEGSNSWVIAFHATPFHPNPVFA